jgi:Cys-tRNA(Pro)/Cys-tRNA(Cys) deacylase
MKGATPAMVALDRAAVSYQVHHLADAEGGDMTELGYGRAAAQALGVDESRVFKTLLVSLQGGPLTQAVAIVPVSGQLSLKAVAHALGAKRSEMMEPRVAERLTGYVVGGISPFGQRKALPTVIDETCVLHETIFVSGGRRGLDIELAPDDLVGALSATVAAIAA